MFKSLVNISLRNFINWIFDEYHFFFKTGFKMINMAKLAVLVDLLFGVALSTHLSFNGRKITDPLGRIKSFK